jgi:5-methylthioadenosine/S-adenosylhomocysteine deaminase
MLRRSHVQRYPTLARVWLLALSCSSALAQTPKLVVRNAHIMTMAQDQREPIVGYISVARDGTILTVAPGEPDASLHPSKVVDAHGDFMIPGFISAHSHLWQAAYRGLAQDKTEPGWGLDLYGQHAIRATPEDTYWFCLYGALDHLSHGITTAFDFALNRGAVSNKDNAYDQAQFRAKIDSGIRFVHGYAAGGGGGARPASAAPTAGGTASAAGTTNAARPAAASETLDQSRARLQAFIDWIASQHPTSQYFSVMLSGAGSSAATLMKEFHIGNQTHYLEAPDNEAQQRSTFRAMMESGVLGPTFYFGHFIHTDDFILQETAKAGAGMSWNPESNGRLASGVADIPKYLKMGVRVGMGVDGEASADLADPFENMRTGLYAIRDKYEDGSVMSPYQVLWLHTMGSADVMNIKDKVGSLERGKFADFLLVSPARLGPVLEDPYANLVFVAGERDVDSVYVGGELMVDHNQLTHQDLSKVQTESDRRVIAIK